MLGADFVNSTVTLQDVGLSFTPLPNKVYEFRVVLALRTATASSTPRPAIAWPTGCTEGIVDMRIANTIAAGNVQFGDLTGTVELPVGALPNTTQSWPAVIEGFLATGPSPSGALRVQVAAETAAVATTVRAKSFLSYRVVA